MPNLTASRYDRDVAHAELPILASGKRALAGSQGHDELWPRVAVSFVRWLLHLLFRVRLEGTLPTTGPYILVANHQGWSDAFLLLALLPSKPRLHFIADRAETMTLWWKRLILRSLGVVVAVDREQRSDRRAIETALRILEGGGVLGLFPEGRVSHAEAQLGPFRRGVGYLALKAQVPVVPVWLRGTAELYLGRELTARVGALRLPPNEEPRHETTELFAEQIRGDLVAMSEPWVEPVGIVKRWRWLTNIL